MRHPGEIDGFREGEILVARFTDPTWTSVFPLARGIVTEVGGWLSHAAIQAREYGLTGIVGAAGALDALETGELVCLHADGTIERLGERRAEDRIPISAAIAVRCEAETIHARLGDLSPHGALLLVPDHQFTIGDRIGLAIATVPDDLAATVIRNGMPGIYGLRLDHTLAPELEASLRASYERTVQGAA